MADIQAAQDRTGIRTFTVFAVRLNTLSPCTFIVEGYGPSEAVLRILLEQDDDHRSPIIIAGILEGEHISLPVWDKIH